VLGGEVPGEQTVPRAEAWAATVLLLRTHYNAVARYAIDASYVTNGISKRTRLEKGRNGDIWTLFFALLGFRTAELGIAKVTSHLEEVALEAVQADIASICDIIGNALADEAASLAAQRLRPTAAECKEADLTHRLAFDICIRLAFTQARVWELTDDVRIYEAPPESVEADTSLESVTESIKEQLSAQGHDLVLAQRGDEAGHTCTRCGDFHNRANLNKWLTAAACRPKPTAKDRKAAFEEEFSRKAKAARMIRESLVVHGSDEEEEEEDEEEEEEDKAKGAKQSKQGEHIPKPTTEVDQDEALEINDEIELNRKGGRARVVIKPFCGKIESHGTASKMSSEINKNKTEKEKVHCTGSEGKNASKCIHPKGLRKRIKEAETLEEAMSILLAASSAEKTLRAVIRNAATLESALEARLETESPEDEQED